MNIVPRSGGNVMRGSFFASGTGDGLQSDNITPSLRAQGVTAATPLSRVYDVSGTIGGPLQKDRLWYFVNAHVGGSTKDSANVYYNRNAADASKWLYSPDVNRREYSDRTYENASGRVTWQTDAPQQGHGFLGRAGPLPDVYAAPRRDSPSPRASRRKLWASSAAGWT